MKQAKPTIMMDLPEIARRTGLPFAKLRYVCDEPILDWESAVHRHAKQGKGTTRQFSVFHAYVLSFTTCLLSAGLGRRVARRVIEVFCENAYYEALKTSEAGVLAHAAQLFFNAEGLRLELGDGRFLRLIALDTKHKKQAFDWQSLDGEDGPGRGYDPLTLLTIDLDRLKKRLTGDA